jgi:DNA-directed RNA polymerase III subunit RPC3
MTAKDQEDLADLDDVVRKLALAEARCEMVVFILRDLPGWPTRKAIG